MIVYYDPNTHLITGMSSKLNAANQFPYFETNDPIAEKIFLGNEKPSLYKVSIEDNKGYLVKKATTARALTVKERFHLVQQNSKPVDFKILQDTSIKKLIINLDKKIFNEWQQKIDNINLIACVPYDPFQPLWSSNIPFKNLDKEYIIDYQGTDNICFFTEKIFESYGHECIESSRS